jgi:transposase
MHVTFSLITSKHHRSNPWRLGGAVDFVEVYCVTVIQLVPPFLNKKQKTIDGQ